MENLSLSEIYNVYLLKLAETKNTHIHFNEAVKIISEKTTFFTKNTKCIIPENYAKMIEENYYKKPENYICCKCKQETDCFKATNYSGGNNVAFCINGYKTLLIDTDLDIILKQNYSNTEEAVIINMIQKKNPIPLAGYQKLFKESWKYVDLKLFPECEFIFTFLEYKCWIFLGDSFPGNIDSINEKLRAFSNIQNKKLFVYSEKFIDYCYSHLSEKIPQYIFIECCNFNSI